ncbi:MAG: PorP/SprF family type IX secretion system membrane protein [Saprospiraceae bacterium]|nr:PorP/SprF family type IX secretion system membrane protein [Saprospiraceae bacterium]
MRHIYAVGFFILTLCCSGDLAAQHTPQYSLYMLDRYQFNPAYAGMDASLSINAAYRTQWVDLPGNPVQEHINAHMPLYLLNGAVGVKLMHETIGAENTVRASVSYNYVLEGNFGLISAGVSAGIIQKSLDGALLRAPDGEYEGPTIIHNDPNLPIGLVRGIKPLVAAGAYYIGDQFEAGISVTDVSFGALEFDGIRFSGRPALVAFGEYYLEGLEGFDIYPTFLLRSDLSQTQVEVAVRGVYDDFLSAGVGLRGYSTHTLDAVVLFAGLKLSEHVSMAYGFDLTISPLSQATRGTHEVVLKYNLNKIIGAGLPPPVIYSPRFR